VLVQLDIETGRAADRSLPDELGDGDIEAAVESPLQ
jgi:hypothetical protein